jgi:processive 1,2-diacylglycerol beta-glucosyltransferase
LVVYSRVGGGHFSAARALAAALGATGCVDARLVDVYLECGRFPVTLFPKAYAWLARGHPAAWRAVYRGSELPPTDPGLILGPFLRPGLRALTRGYRPDLIVSVLPVVNGLLAESARAVGARMEVVLTDWHAVHPFWVGRGVDQYTAPTESSRSDCVKFGAAPNAVCVEGIPVRREFTAEARTSSAAARPRILVMVGAEGSPRALGNVAYLARAGLTAEMVVVCGRDGELRRKVQALPSAMPIRTLGYVEDVADLMRSADLLVTKAGGVSLAEAFCCRVPVVIHDVLPGAAGGAGRSRLRSCAAARQRKDRVGHGRSVGVRRGGRVASPRRGSRVKPSHWDHRARSSR